MKKERFYAYTLEDLKKYVKDSICWSDVCRKAGVSLCTFNFKRMQRLCEDNKISHTHFNKKKAFRRNKKEWTAEEVFVENCTLHRQQLRPILIRLGFYPGECECCGVKDNDWLGAPIIIEIDHINGDSDDNRKENLRWLCPNCHSQTPTYRRRIIKDKQ